VDHYLFLAENDEYDVNALEAVGASEEVKLLIADAMKADPTERKSAAELLQYGFWGDLRRGV
jgi:nanoRNase/pAp phosphatase (c-di-AMP/oligoRNAs hydrolase)